MLLHGGVSPHNDKARAINCRGLGTCGTCAVEIRQALDIKSCLTISSSFNSTHAFRRIVLE